MDTTLIFVVIEDDFQMTVMIDDFLREKYPESEVYIFSSGEVALEATYPSPDIILLDFQLNSSDSKAMNGLQTLMKLKKLYNAPIIFLTGQEDPKVAANIIKYGAYDYIVKNQKAFIKLEAVIKKIINEPSRKIMSRNEIFALIIAVIVVLVIGFFFGLYK